MKSLLALVASFLTVSLSACHWSEFDFTAIQRFGDVEIMVGLKSVSAFAEYRKVVVISFAGKTQSRHELLMDTGGYADVRVDECDNSFLITASTDDNALEVEKATGKAREVRTADIPSSCRALGEFNFDAKDYSVYRFFAMNP